MGGPIKNDSRASDEVVFSAQTLKNKENTEMHKIYTEKDFIELAIAETKQLEKFHNRHGGNTKFKCLKHMVAIHEDYDHEPPKLILKIRRTTGGGKNRIIETVFEEVYLSS
tara:strand:+ start:1159 stop:1491 length:333 start_codon:yes stop_codon:yes gene_type:complete